MPEDTKPQNKVNEPVLSHTSDPEPSAPSAVPALPLLPAHCDAHSFLISIIQNMGIIFYFLQPRLSIISDRETSTPCELIAFRSSVTNLQHVFRSVPLTAVVLDPISGT